MKTVLVTGGAGFLGSHLSERLLKEGFQVRILDNFSSGRQENLSHLKNSFLEVVEGDVRDREKVEGAVKGVDFIFHLAALTSVPLSLKEPSLCEEVNVLGSLNLIEAAVRKKVKKFVFSSSSAVYGEAKELPVKEEFPLNPLSPYALSKLTVEKYLEFYFPDLASVSLRFFNVFGSRQDPTSEYAAVIPRFISQLKEGRELTVYGDGEQTRDFLYVSDAVESFILALKVNFASPAVFNIGAGRKVSISELIAILEEIAGKKAEVRYLPSRPGDIKHSQADISRAKRLLGFKPRFSLYEGLKTVYLN